MKKAGLENVHTQPAMVPHWVRGKESATMVGPVDRPLTMLGLGMSVGTPKQGITGEVVFANSFDDLTAMGKGKVTGKIVLFNPDWNGYGGTVMYRTNGASRAAQMGAVAMLVRSMTGTSVQSPHTGTMVYADGVPKIPAAAITVEDAAFIERTIKAGEAVKVRLRMEATLLTEAESHNVIREIPGTLKPEEVVVIELKR